MRVAIVDIGSNSTRLLACDVDFELRRVNELDRRSIVTRLGDGVDARSQLSRVAIGRVVSVLEQYAAAVAEWDCEASIALMTSAVRDASNPHALITEVNRLGFEARVLSGEEEAALMFSGAMSDRQASSAGTAVIDIGGGSTEFVIGLESTAIFHVSLQAGVVRMSERHLRSDPATDEELAALSADAKKVFSDGLSAAPRSEVRHGIAVAGTATSAAAIDQRLEPYDSEKVHGYMLSAETLEKLLARLAAMSESARKQVIGLHPDRSGTIVAGLVLLIEALKALELSEVEVSEHDILRGGALMLASRGNGERA